MKNKIRIAVVMLFFLNSASAETLETDFYKAEVPEGWLVSRDTSGLWAMEPSGNNLPLKATVLVNRLRATPELYLQGTARLWSSKGEVEVLEDASKPQEGLIVFLIRPKLEEQDSVLKFVQWQDDLMVITSLMFPVKHLQEALQTGERFSETVELKPIDFQPKRLKALISETLKKHDESSEDLMDPSLVRTEMGSFRQDWEPYFPHYKPPLYLAFQAYLEARFDASFAQVNGPGLGMPQDLIQSRFQSVDNRKAELLPLLDAPFDPDGESKDSL